MTLAAPLARALAKHPPKVTFEAWAGTPVSTIRHDHASLLAALRNDPETLAALAEALHHYHMPMLWRVWVGDHEERWTSDQFAAALADALFGAKP